MRKQRLILSVKTQCQYPKAIMGKVSKRIVTVVFENTTLSEIHSAKLFCGSNKGNINILSSSINCPSWKGQLVNIGMSEGTFMGI